MIVAPPEKEITLPSEDVCFELTSQQLEKIKKAASIYQVPDVSVIGEAGVIKLVCRDKKNDTSNKFDIVVGENATADYTFYFKVENLKMMAGDYDVAVSSKSISHFKNTKLPIEYWIALEPDSVFDAG